MAVLVRGLRRNDPLCAVEREGALGRLRAGERVEEIAAAFGCSGRTLQRLFADSLVKRRRIGQSELRLSFAEREQISRGLAVADSARAIGRRLKRSASTITRGDQRQRRAGRLPSAARASTGDRLLGATQAGQALAAAAAAGRGRGRPCAAVVAAADIGQTQA
jgi:AraC-like DNA-binding protein